MLKLAKFVPAVLLAVCLMCGCSQRRGIVQVRIVVTSGMHGRIYSDDPLTGERRDASAARLASFLKRQHESFDNLLYIDAGDIMRGSVEAYHDRSAVFEQTNLCALTCNSLGCDAVVPGDMDFALGGENMYNFYSVSDAVMLCANVGYDEPGDFFPPYRTFISHGVKISVIGLTCGSMGEYLPEDIFSGMKFQDPVQTAAALIPVIREKDSPDVIVAVTHGVPSDRLANSVPEIDLVIDGAELSGVSLATVTADFTMDEPVFSISTETALLSSSEPDQDFEKELAGRKALLFHYLDSTLGSLGTDIDCRGSFWRPSTGVSLVHKYQMRHHGAQISLATVPAPGFYQNAGQFKGRDAFRVFPNEENMVSVMMRGSEVVAILEFSAEQFYNTVKKAGDPLLKLEQAGGGKMKFAADPSLMISAAGIDYTIDITQPYGKRVKVLSMADGNVFDENRLYRTTMPVSLYSRSSSPLTAVPGLDFVTLPQRLNTSSRTDLRYYLITDMFVSAENKTPLPVTAAGTWHLVPEKLAAGCLAHDTLNIGYDRLY